MFSRLSKQFVKSEKAAGFLLLQAFDPEVGQVAMG